MISCRRSGLRSCSLTAGSADRAGKRMRRRDCHALTSSLEWHEDSRAITEHRLYRDNGTEKKLRGHGAPFARAPLLLVDHLQQNSHDRTSAVFLYGASRRFPFLGNAGAVTAACCPRVWKHLLHKHLEFAKRGTEDPFLWHGIGPPHHALQLHLAMTCDLVLPGTRIRRCCHSSDEAEYVFSSRMSWRADCERSRSTRLGCGSDDDHVTRSNVR